MKFKRKLKLMLSIVLVIAMTVMQFSYAAAEETVQDEQSTTVTWEDKGDFPYITKVELTDGDGNLISDENHVNPNDKIRIKYEFNIPNNVEVHAGEMYTISIPKGFHLDGGLPESQLDKEGKYNVTWQLNDDIITIKFYEDLDKISNIKGYIALDCWIDTDVITEGDGETVDFVVNGEKFECDIYYDKYPKATSATVKKSGAYDSTTKEITWTITVTPNSTDATLANVTVKDAFTNSEHQEYVKGSTTVAGVSIPDTDLNFTESGFEYTFPEGTIGGAKKITYKTKPTDAFYNSQEDNIKNNVKVYLPNGDKTSEADASVKVRQTSISKTTVGKYDAANKVLKWKITLNKDNRSMKNAKVTDMYPEGTHIDTSSIKINDILLKDTDVTYQQKDNQIIFLLGDISKETYITYDLVIDDFSKLPKTVDGEYTEYTVKNSVLLNVNDSQEYSYTAKGKIGVGKKEISFSKSGAISTSSDNGFIIFWKIKANYTSLEEIQEAFVISDVIPEGQEYIKGTAKIKLYRNGAETSGVYIADEDIYDESKRKLSYKIIPNKTVIGDYTVNEDDGVMLYFYTSVKDIELGNATSTKYSNTAKLAIGDKEKEATKQLTANFNNMISKIGSYDYANELYYWLITANSQKTALKNPVIKETLPENHVMAEDFITINNTKVTLDGKVNWIYQAWYDEKAGTVTIKVNNGKYITSALYIGLKTKSVVDEQTGSKATNTAKLSAENIDKEFSVSSTVEHKALPILQKKTDYSRGNIIPWTVNINLDYEDKGQELKLEDKLQAGLSLDKESVKLYEGAVSSDGKSITAGNEIEIPAENIRYDDTTGVFECILPKEVEAHKYYVLKFSTEIVDRNIEQVSNTITLYGMESTEEGKSTVINIKAVSSSSGIEGESGSVRIVKKDSKTEESIQNVSFRLLDKNQKPIEAAGWATTDKDGIAEFNDWLRFDTQYYVQEVRTAEGYVYNDTMYPVMIKSSDDSKIFEVVVYNDPIVATATPTAIVATPTPTAIVITPTPTAIVITPTPTAIVVTPTPTAIVTTPTPTAIIVTPTPTAVIVTPPPTLPPIIWPATVPPTPTTPPIIWVGTPEPTKTPEPTVTPTTKPTVTPTEPIQTVVPTEQPTKVPTQEPSVVPETKNPIPTENPTTKPTVTPTEPIQTVVPTEQPTEMPTLEPTVAPTTGAAIIPDEELPGAPVTANPTSAPTTSADNKQTPEPGKKSTGNNTTVSPDTQDNSQLYEWMLIFTISGLIIVFMIIKNRKERKKEK